MSNAALQGAREALTKIAQAVDNGHSRRDILQACQEEVERPMSKEAAQDDETVRRRNGELSIVRNFMAKQAHYAGCHEIQNEREALIDSINKVASELQTLEQTIR